MAEAVAATTDTVMPVSEIKTGMKGYGLTVFRGTEPERFDVEVLGVIRQFRPHQDLVLIKTSHPRLEIAKVVAGMSGSPIFLNNKMIGAYAYGWQFGSEPIAGVTPILLGGMGDGAAKLARDLLEPLGLEPVQGGGAGNAVDADAPTRFVNGGAIGVQLVSGDISAMGLGTVTRVEGDKLVAFGHPMMNGGVTAMPTAIGRVHWVLASQMRSFKLGEAVRPLGALVNDRQAAIVVDSKSVAPRFPATVEIEGVPGAPHKSWSFTIAHEKFMSPSFVAIPVGSAIEATTSERRDVTWRATTEIVVAGYGTIRLEDGGVAVGGTPDADEWVRSRAVRAIGAILNNPWQTARVEKLTTKLSVRFARDSYRLRGADALADVIDAGQP